MTNKDIDTSSPERLRVDLLKSKYRTSLKIDTDKIPSDQLSEGLRTAFSAKDPSWEDSEHILDVYEQDDGTLRGLLVSQRKGAVNDGRQSMIFGGQNRIFHITEADLQKLQEVFEKIV